jgi:phospholipid/cholesterol/gamma-HCH transport system substrate-binding protein
MAQERSIEVKVGILILVSLGILAAFVLVMGGINFERTYTQYVDFDDPGGLQTGAPVKIAGMKVGSVIEMEFRGGKIDAQTNRPVMVRAKLAVQAKYRDAIHDDAGFYVTTQGVLGELFLAIEPGSPNRAVLNADDMKQIPKGIGPPRLDLFFSKAYQLLDMTVTGLNNNRDLVKDIAVNANGLLAGLNGSITDNRDRINRIMQNLETLTGEANILVKDTRTNIVDSPKVQHTLDNVEKITTDIQKDSGPLMKDARESLANLNRAAQVIGDPEGQAKLKKTLQDISELATKANATASDAQEIVAHIRGGKGTVGGLVMDEEVYDDVQEMVRDLKHNPWKFLWKN